MKDNIYLNSVISLGQFLTQFIENKEDSPDKKNLILPEFHSKFRMILQKASEKNPWFSAENLDFCIKSWANALSENNLKQWLSAYDFDKIQQKNPKKIALILAGNIPLVGFHDFLCVILSGNKAVVKLSSNDNVLLPFFVEILSQFSAEIKNQVEYSSSQITDYEAVIATGSNNTARYFEYYFKNKPHIIRKNRNSVAVLTGKESFEDLQNLSKDIFTYFGLGCRNVSKIFVPENYHFDAFFKAIFHYNYLLENQKYTNNYDYNKAVYLMSRFNILDNGFFILKEEEKYASPIASLNYEFYTSEENLKEKLQKDAEQIQCVVGNFDFENKIDFGKTQTPELWQYADGIDTMEFLLNL